MYVRWACLFIQAVYILGGLGVCRLCMLGDSLLRYPYGSTESIDVWCTKNSTGPLASRYCQTTNFTQVCADHFTNDNISIVVGIPGLQSGTFHSMSIVHMAVTHKTPLLKCIIQRHFKINLQKRDQWPGSLTFLRVHLPKFAL